MSKKEMTAVEYLRERKRMADKGVVAPCAIREDTFPEEAVAIVRKWAEGHPVKTMMDDFFERFPNAPKESEGEPTCCPHSLGYVQSKFCPDHYNCLACWSRPLEES